MLNRSRWLQQGTFEFDGRDYAMQVTDMGRKASKSLHVEWINDSKKIILSGRVDEDEIRISFYDDDLAIIQELYNQLRSIGARYDSGNRTSVVFQRQPHVYCDINIQKNQSHFFECFLQPLITRKFIDDEFISRVYNEMHKEIGCTRPSKSTNASTLSVLNVIGASKLSGNMSAIAPEKVAIVKNDVALVNNATISNDNNKLEEKENVSVSCFKL